MAADDDLLRILEREYDAVFANRREANRESRERFLRAIRGDWTEYEAELRGGARGWAKKGLAFSEWFDANRGFLHDFGTRIERELGADRPRFLAAFEAHQRFGDRALSILGAAYVEERSEAARASEERYRLLFESSPY